MENKIIKSETKFVGAVFEVELRTVELPNGKVGERGVVVHNGASAIVAVTDDGKLVFVRQYRDAVGDTILEIPAGRLAKGEDPAACALRELEEETGYRASRLTLMIKFFPVVGYSTEVIHLYLAEGLAPGKPNTDEDEFVDVEEISPDDALRLIDEGKIIDGKTIAAVLLYARTKA